MDAKKSPRREPTHSALHGLPGAWAAFSSKQERLREVLQTLRNEGAVPPSTVPLLDELEKGMQQLVVTDPMTGCFNRGYLEMVLTRIADHQGRIAGPYALMLLDMDYFKQINDLYGHQVGDRCLVDLAHLLRSELRQGESLFRLGGDEFLFLLPGESESGVRLRARQVQKRIQQDLHLPDPVTLPLSASVGMLVVQAGQAALTSSELLEHVDQALYTSKRSGRNRSTLWTPHLPDGSMPNAHGEDEGELDPVRLRIERDQAREFSVDIMSAILDAREFETSLHSERVTRVTAFLMEKLNLPEEQRIGVLQGARLHDIGKIAIPEHILHKQTPLTESELHVLRRHPEIGYRFVATCPFLREAGEVILHHHEKWDGSGYPHGLAGTDIPLSARIFSLADTYDSMRANRVYRESIPPDRVAEELRSQAGKQFDPEITRIVLGHLDEIEAIGYWQE